MAKMTGYGAFASVGFAIGAVYKLWVDTGLNTSLFDSESMTPLLEFGGLGGIVGLIICWFL